MQLEAKQAQYAWIEKKNLECANTEPIDTVFENEKEKFIALKALFGFPQPFACEKGYILVSDDSFLLPDPEYYNVTVLFAKHPADKLQYLFHLIPVTKVDSAITIEFTADDYGSDNYVLLMGFDMIPTYR